MMRNTIILLLSVITFISYGQETKENYFNKRTQHSISIEYLTASYSIARKLPNDKIFGVRAKVGFARKFNLIPTSYEFKYYELEEPETEFPPFSDPEGIITTAEVEFFDSFDDLIYLQFFRRILLSEKFIMDLGIYTNIGYFDKSDIINDGLIGLGISSKFFYNINRFHIGTGIDGGYNFIIDPSVSKGFFGLYFSPLMIGYNF